MSRPIISLLMRGRFGNMMFQYAFARSYAERHGCELHTQSWVGQKIFQLSDPLISVFEEQMMPRRDENTLHEGQTNICFLSYFQQQKALTYTKRDCQRWFKLRPEVESALKTALPLPEPYAAHWRGGDYFGYGYPVVSRSSYEQFATMYGIPMMIWVDEEHPAKIEGLDPELEFLPDFYRLMTAETLLRGNSSFSWWAATLGNGKVFAPVIAGLEGGKQHHCQFVSGNYPRLANFDFTTDLHLQP